jgi:hypothetical protein
MASQFRTAHIRDANSALRTVLVDVSAVVKPTPQLMAALAAHADSPALVAIRKAQAAGGTAPRLPAVNNLTAAAEVTGLRVRPRNTPDRASAAAGSSSPASRRHGAGHAHSPSAEVDVQSSLRPYSRHLVVPMLAAQVVEHERLADETVRRAFGHPNVAVTDRTRGADAAVSPRDAEQQLHPPATVTLTSALSRLGRHGLNAQRASASTDANVALRRAMAESTSLLDSVERAVAEVPSILDAARDAPEAQRQRQRQQRLTQPRRMSPLSGQRSPPPDGVLHRDLPHHPPAADGRAGASDANVPLQRKGTLPPAASYDTTAAPRSPRRGFFDAVRRQATSVALRSNARQLLADASAEAHVLQASLAVGGSFRSQAPSPTAASPSASQRRASARQSPTHRETGSPLRPGKLGGTGSVAEELDWGSASARSATVGPGRSSPLTQQSPLSAGTTAEADVGVAEQARLRLVSVLKQQNLDPPRNRRPSPPPPRAMSERMQCIARERQRLALARSRTSTAGAPSLDQPSPLANAATGGAPYVRPERIPLRTATAGTERLVVREPDPADGADAVLSLIRQVTKARSDALAERRRRSSTRV